MEENPLVECACGCGGTLIPYDSRGRARKFLPSHWSRLQPNKHSIVICENCGKEISRPQWHINKVERTFCNGQCHGQWATRTGFRSGENNGHYNTITVPCAGCGAPVSKAESMIKRRNNRVYCPDCILIARSGTNEEYPAAFSSSLRRTIRKRDDYTCQICHTKPDHTLHVHHIDCDKQNNDEMNLISVCRSCHGLTILAVKSWQQKLTSLMRERFSPPPAEHQPAEPSLFSE